MTTRYALSLALVTGFALGTLAIMPSVARDAPMMDKKPASPGLAIGAKAPLTLALATADGQRTMLGKQMGRKGLVLVLTRSAAWCPYCKAQMIGLKDIQAGVAQRGYRMAALTYDKPEVLKRFTKERTINYALLSDDDSRMIDALRLRDPQYPAGSPASGVPYPTILVIAPNGMIKAKNVSTDYKVRPANAAVLAMIDGVTG